jgi:6-phosphogluconate dehydrogenase
MELAMIGLGRMGANMAERLLKGGHRVIVFDTNPDAVALMAGKGAVPAASIAQAAHSQSPPRVFWIMVPAGQPVDDVLGALYAVAESGDLLVDGGNSQYKDTLRRAAAASARNLRYVDVGTSGGIWGLAEGYSMMVGGDKDAVELLRPALETLAPARDRGWGHVGPVGSGHFVKMVHNGIEYGMMQSYAEGFSILQHKADFELDLHQVSEIWRYGSVVRSWLLDLMSEALGENPELAGVAPFVADSGEGRWTLAEAMDLNVPAPAITAALLERIRSREVDSFADRLLSVTRNKFGGHPVKTDG